MIYRYKYTDKKGGEIEINHPMKDDARTEHAGRPVQRIFEGGRHIIFKGQGFYCTDYKEKK